MRLRSDSVKSYRIRSKNEKKKEAPPIAKVAPPIAFAIPANISPASVGKYVSNEIEEKFLIPLTSSTTANLNIVAVQVAKEKMRMNKVTLQLGVDWLPIKMKLEWEKK